MKVLFFIDSLGSGGAQRQMVELAKTFNDNGHYCEFLVFHEKQFFKPDLDEVNIKVVQIPHKTYFGRAVKYMSYIRKGNYDVVVSFLDYPNLFNVLAGLPSKKHKIIVGERSADPSITTKWSRRIRRFFHRYADYVVSNSHNNKNLISSIYPNLKNQKVIYNLIDLEKWKPRQSKIKLPKVRVISAATHRKLKNAKVLIEALNGLTEEEKKNIKVDWYGKTSADGTYQENYNLIKEYNLENVINLLPPSNDLHLKMRDYNVIGLYSFVEGFPNVICEGMASGKYVVSSRVSDVPMILSGSDNALFNHDCPQELTMIFRKLINDYSIQYIEEVGMENRKIAESLFNKEKIYSQYYELLNK